MSEDKNKIGSNANITENKDKAKISIQFGNAALARVKKVMTNYGEIKLNKNNHHTSSNSNLLNKIHQNLKQEEETSSTSGNIDYRTKLNDAIRNYSQEQVVHHTKKTPIVETSSHHTTNISPVLPTPHEINSSISTKDGAKNLNPKDSGDTNFSSKSSLTSSFSGAPNVVKKSTASFNKNKNYPHKKDLYSQETKLGKNAKLENKANKIVEKYGIQRITTLASEEEIDNIDFLKDVLAVENTVEITQEHLNEDEEKILGKSLSFRPLNYDDLSNVAVRKRERKSYNRSTKATYNPVIKTVEIYDSISVKKLAQAMFEKVEKVLKVLAQMKVEANSDTELEGDIAHLVAEEMGHNVIRLKHQTIQDLVAQSMQNIVPSTLRIPVVTVMGHVDHGKTSLLDAIRKSQLASKEHGGITQHIGAYVVEHGGKNITFLDTPGHAAFSTLRARGAKLTDIAILVVAADDGIQPQTIEAINHIKAAGVPMIVAINKIDKSDANPSAIKQNLLQYEVLLEEYGGEIMAVEVSAKNNTNIDKLLEAILLQAEIPEIKCDIQAKAFGTVIEVKLDKNRGPIATVILQHGVLKIGDILVSGTAYAKIKTLANENKERLKEIIPGIPVEIVGFESLPNSGDIVNYLSSESDARKLIALRQQEIKSSTFKPFDIAEAFGATLKKDVNLIIKADTFGSLEAITGMISKIQHEDLAVKIIHKGIGNINESDVALAKATQASLIGFQIDIDIRVKDKIEKKEVNAKIYNIIYELIDEIKALVSGHLEAIKHEDLIGKAEVKQVFSLSKSVVIAGCMINSGYVSRSSIAKVIRNGILVTTSVIKTLKRIKEDVKEVKQGYECGLQLQNSFEFQVGDLIECYEERLERPIINL